MTRAVLEMPPARALEQLESDLDLSTEEVAGAVGTSTRTIRRWRHNETHPQLEPERRLAALIDLSRRLRDTFGSSEAGRAWLHESNRYLGGMTPADAVLAGRVDRVEAALEALDSGIFL